MKKIQSDSWSDVMEALVRYREVTTNTEEYDNPKEILGILKWWIKRYDIEGFRLAAEKDMHNSGYGSPWYILRLVPNINTNREGKVLLERDY